MSNLCFTWESRDSPDLFSLSMGARANLYLNCYIRAAFNSKFKFVNSPFPFTLSILKRRIWSFCRGRPRNVPKSIMHVQSHCAATDQSIRSNLRTVRARIALLHVYVRLANFTTKNCFRSPNLPIWSWMNTQRWKKYPHANSMHVAEVEEFQVNETCWWILSNWRHHT